MKMKRKLIILGITMVFIFSIFMSQPTAFANDCSDYNFERSVQQESRLFYSLATGFVTLLYDLYNFEEYTIPPNPVVQYLWKHEFTLFYKVITVHDNAVLLTNNYRNHNDLSLETITTDSGTGFENFDHTLSLCHFYIPDDRSAMWGANETLITSSNPATLISTIGVIIYKDNGNYPYTEPQTYSIN